MSQLNLLFALTLAFLCCFGNAMRFELRSGHTKCIAEDIKHNAMTVGNYFVVNPNEGSILPDSHKITVKVTSPHGNNYHHKDKVDSGDFAFTAAEAGDYTACFLVPDHKPPLTVAVEFDWRTGVAAKDWSNIAKKGQIEAMEFELRKLYETVTSIHDEMFYLRERIRLVIAFVVIDLSLDLATQYPFGWYREEEMQDLNKATNTKMFTLSFLSILVCLSVAGMQLWHLKSFFERKKLL